MDEIRPAFQRRWSEIARVESPTYQLQLMTVDDMNEIVIIAEHESGGLFFLPEEASHKPHISQVIHAGDRHGWTDQKTKDFIQVTFEVPVWNLRLPKSIITQEPILGEEFKSMDADWVIAGLVRGVHSIVLCLVPLAALDRR